MKIGNKTIEKATELLGGLLNSYQNELDKAYLKSDDTLAVSLTLKISPDQHGNKLKADIKFVADQVKDSANGHADEDQLSFDDVQWNVTPIWQKPKDRRGKVGNPPRFKPLGG